MTTSAPRSRLSALLPEGPAAWTTVIFFLLVSLPLAAVARDERSGWILATSPVDAICGVNSLLGWSWTLGAQPFHKENVPALEQVAMFSGGSSTFDMYSVRAVYTFAAALLEPLLGVVRALLVVNWLSWAAAVWASWRLARAVFDDELAGLIAAAFATLGIGMVVHVGDLSAHLMAFAAYGVGVLALYESGVWRERLPARTHAALGVGLALACLQYNSGISLTVAYAVVAWRHNRRRDIALALLIALSSQHLWHAMLNLLSGMTAGAWSWTNFNAMERHYLRLSLDAWGRLLAEGPGPVLRALATAALDFLLHDSPTTVLAGLLSFVLLPRPTLLLFSVSFALPICAGLAFSQGVYARGYIVYGIAILTHVAVAGALARAIRRGGTARVAGVALLLALLSAHLAWSTAHVRGGSVAPLGLYFVGTIRSPLVGAPRPRVLSLTGAEPTPTLFFGDATLEAAGLDVIFATVPNETRFLPACLARGFFFAYLAALAALALQESRRRGALVALALACLASSVLPAWTLQERPSANNIEDAIRLAPGESLRYEVQLSGAFARELTARAAPGVTLELLVPGAGSCAVSSWLGGRELPLGSRERSAGLQVPPRDFLGALAASRTLVVQVAATDRRASLAGWQRAGLPGRTLALSRSTKEAPRVLPILELRLRSSDGTLVLAGF